MMSDEDVFLQALRADPGDIPLRQVYADWLEDRDDPRAEYLRLLLAGADADPGSCRRLDELRPALDPQWVALVHPAAVYFGEYLVVRELARGLLTTVYEAIHTSFNNRRITLQILQRPQYAARFLQAARSQAALPHPRIPALHMVGEWEGQPFIVRAFVEGDDLQNGIASSPRTPAEVGRIVADIAGALDVAHAQGIVHGYVHPRHLLLGRDGAAWLIGFGEMPAADFPIAGNPLHCAPEQLEANGPVTPQTDVYLLAESALWLLTGQHPFVRHWGIERLREAKRTPWAWPAGLRPHQNLPDSLVPVLQRALSPTPADRYPTAGEFAAAFAAGVQAAERPRSWWRIW
jgi:serine/threonine-protein kinase